ncbi:late embryogenesis abundant protein-related/LEA protein-related [Forsythia ovata]|uniref:Late embryogenesis abundant protein-related/LEA protein-related n=1 Tax=Forsythia ovata TaxID=205694 RepID=A0ABD1WJW5_9LAMI
MDWLMKCFLDKGCNYPGAVCQDPRFVGGDGITFYFHGRKDQDFCLVSDKNLHINAHFIGKRNPKLKRDFTWVQSIGIMFDNHKILVAAKRTSTWDDNEDHLVLSFDDKPVSLSLPTNVGSKWDSHILPEVSISRTSNTNGILIDVSNNFRITANVVPITHKESKVHGYGITDEDCFAHLEVGFKFKNLSDAVDGVLGQTYRRNYESKIKVNDPMPVMGGAHKFRTSGIFDTNCAVSRFGKKDFNAKVGFAGKGRNSL